MGQGSNFASKSQNKLVLLNLDGLLLKEIEFEKFSLIADQIMLVSSGKLYAVANDGAKFSQFVRKF